MPKVAGFGLGKLGFPWTLILRELGFDVWGVDPNEKLVEAINNGTYETWEPEVTDLLRRYRPKATTDPVEALQGADRADIFVPTPSLATGAFDPSRVADVFEIITREIGHGHVNTTPFPVVIKSTLWPGQTQAIWESCRQCSSELVRLYYCPELVALGDAVKGMRQPSIQFMGVHPDLFEEDSVVTSTRRRGKRALHIMSWAEAEMSKLVLNSFLSTKITFPFDVTKLCMAMPNVDPTTVMEAVGGDPRIGRWGLMPGTLAKGPCLPRDTEALRALSDYLGVGATYLIDAPSMAQMVELNDIMSQLQRAKLVAILGLSYKLGVPYTEDSLGTRIIKQLTRQNRDFYCVDFDTGVLDDIRPEKTDAVVLCLPDQRLADLVHEYFSECPVIIDPWRAL